MRMTTERAGLAPEADLRSIAIKGRRHRPSLTDVKSPLGSNGAEDLFFSKGSASADGFQPPFQSLDDPSSSAAAKGAAVVELRGVVSREERPNEPAIDNARRASPSHLAAAVSDTPASDDELLKLERAFLELHQHALMEGLEPEPEVDVAMRQEMASAALGSSAGFVALADLRSLQIRRSSRDVALVDGLFLQKGRSSKGTIEWLQDSANPPEQRRADARPSEAPTAPMQAEQASPSIGEPVLAPSVAPTNDDDPSAGSMDETSAAPARSEATPIKGRKASVTPLQTAIIVFGCVAVLASAGIFFPVNAPQSVGDPAPQAARVAAPPIEAPPSHGAVAAQPPQASPPAAQSATSAVEDLLARGDERLRSGDVAAARLFYEKAASAGSARGALMMGATYDPSFLATIGVYGIPGDAKQAATWYQRAHELGGSEVTDLARILGHQ
jgi:hypothetical protein